MIAFSAMLPPALAVPSCLDPREWARINSVANVKWLGGYATSDCHFKGSGRE